MSSPMRTLAAFTDLSVWMAPPVCRCEHLNLIPRSHQSLIKLLYFIHSVIAPEHVWPTPEVSPSQHGIFLASPSDNGFTSSLSSGISSAPQLFSFSVIAINFCVSKYLKDNTVSHTLSPTSSGGSLLNFVSLSFPMSIFDDGAPSAFCSASESLLEASLPADCR
jgi:hypothetical protein